jgi:hypothetical protein
MIDVSTALAAIPSGLRDPLLKAYREIVQNFLEQRWQPSELNGGLFCEIVYTILDGHARGSYASGPSKPSNFPAACQTLEGNTQPHVPRSFRILIPRMLPPLYEVRNNRNVGHTGGDVDPNHMDSAAVLSMCNWVMGELVRFYHGLTTAEAQQVVDALAEVRLPVIWTRGNVKRVLDTKLKLNEQILLLASVTVPPPSSKQLLEWVEYKDAKYFMRTLRNMHKSRCVEFDEKADTVQVLPGGAAVVQQVIRKKRVGGPTP